MLHALKAQKLLCWILHATLRMFKVFSEMSALNPDPYDEQADDSESEGDFEDVLGGNLQPQVELGVMWNADANDAAMEDADEDDDDDAQM